MISARIRLGYSFSVQMHRKGVVMMVHEISLWSTSLTTCNLLSYIIHMPTCYNVLFEGATKYLEEPLGSLEGHGPLGPTLEPPLVHTMDEVPCNTQSKEETVEKGEAKDQVPKTCARAEH